MTFVENTFVVNTFIQYTFMESFSAIIGNFYGTVASVLFDMNVVFCLF